MNKLKILLVHNKTKFCGITDYTNKLFSIINNKTDFLLSDLNFRLILKIFFFKGKILINIHYPYQKITDSFINILILCILKIFFFWKIKIILTLHEFYASSILRKISAVILIFISKKIIVTNISEKKAVENFFKSKIKTEVVPIFSTLIETDYQKSKISEKYCVIFGLILPGRNFEKVFEDFLNTGKTNKLYVVGARHPRYIDYYNSLIQKYKNNEKIEWYIEKSIQEVNNILRNAEFSINYYADGISEKRTSTLFFFKHKIPVIANAGVATPKHLKPLFIEYDLDLLKIFDFVEKNNINDIVDKAYDFYRQNFDENLIADKYKKIFEEI